MNFIINRISEIASLLSQGQGITQTIGTFEGSAAEKMFSALQSAANICNR